MDEEKRIEESAVDYDVDAPEAASVPVPHSANDGEAASHKAKVDALRTKILREYAGAWKRLADM